MRPRRPLAPSIVAAFTAAWLVAGVARADTRDEARALGRAGLALYDRGDYAGALENFRRAYAMFSAPTLGLFNARALEKLGRLVEARDVYKRVAATPIDRRADAAFRKAVEDAKQALASIEPRVPQLTVMAPNAGAEAVITIDGARIERGKPREIDPGEHRVEALEDGRTGRVVVTVAEGDRKSIGVTIPAAAAPPAPVVVVAPEQATSTQRTLGWVTLSVGAVGLLAGGGMGIGALASAGGFSSTCTKGVCPSEASSDVSTYGALRTGATVGLWAGGGLAATGLILVLTAPKGGVRTTALRPSFTLPIKRGDAGSLAVEGTF